MSSRPFSLGPRGFTFSAAACGLKKAGFDLALLVSDVPAQAAAVFTTNRVQAAPVTVSRNHWKRSRNEMRGVVVNSGNANCCTGSEGIEAAVATASKVARELGTAGSSQILVCSTGVIGVPLPVKKILRAIPRLVQERDGAGSAFTRFSRAILTTDTRAKVAAANFRIEGRQVRILGCAKGAGMIHPNMATMLAFLVTDAAISSALLSRALRAAVGQTFNAITVDGDTSTNDTVTLLANGQSGAQKIIREDKQFNKFRRALQSVCKTLALAIVADGEGAQRVVEIEIHGAPSDQAADQIARTIANSPLVKTAMSGGDPNWGRILAAAGRSGVVFAPERVDIRLAGIAVCRNGRELPFDERRAHRQMLRKQVKVTVDLHAGHGHACVWTCDFTAGYIRINSSYRT